MNMLTLEATLFMRVPSTTRKHPCHGQFGRKLPFLPVAARGSKQLRCEANGMHVPSDSFGGVSPERKAGEILRTFFTFAALKIVMAQLEGVGRGDLGSYNAQAYTTLAKFIQENPLKNNCDDWLGKLMERDEMLAVRIMEVRAAYSAEDFEWDHCQRLSVESIVQSNVKLMRSHAKTRFTKMLEPEGEKGPVSDAGEGTEAQDDKS